VLLYSSGGKGKKKAAASGKGHHYSKSFKNHQEFVRVEGDLAQAGLTIAIQEQTNNRLVQDQLDGKKTGVIATRKGLAPWRDNKSLRRLVQDRCESQDHETSWFADALVRHFGVQIFLLSINKYENDEDIYDGEESVKHLQTNEALAHEIEKELRESTGSESSSGASTPDGSEVGTPDDIGELTETLEDQLFCYYEDDRQQLINELKTKLNTKSAEVDDLQNKVKDLQADLRKVHGATAAVPLSPIGQATARSQQKRPRTPDKQLLNGN